MYAKPHISNENDRLLLIEKNYTHLPLMISVAFKYYDPPPLPPSINLPVHSFSGYINDAIFQ